MSSLRALFVANRDFRRLFLASVVSMAGDWFSFVAVADLVTRLTGRPGMAAFVYAATVLPVLLASPIAGAVADRYDRRRILVIADLLRVPVALSLCLAAWWGSIPLAIAAMIALGVGSAFFDPVANAATPNLVAPAHLAEAQALMGAIWGSMLFVGAGLGGIVAETLGLQAAFVIDAASFAVSAWLVAGIERPMQEVTPPGEAVDRRGELREAVRYIQRDGLVRRLVLAKLGVSSANGIVGLLPALAYGKFAGTSVATGLLFAARGLGALLGPLLARVLVGGAPGPRAILAVCGASTLLYAAVYAALPAVPWFTLALVLVVVAHLGGGAQWTMSVYGLQVATPDRLRGRVLAFDFGLATFLIGCSAVVAGLLADELGEARTTWWLAGVGAVYGAIWIVWSLAGARRTWAPEPPASGAG